MWSGRGKERETERKKKAERERERERNLEDRRSFARTTAATTVQ